jgi:hypothetical protein
MTSEVAVTINGVEHLLRGHRAKKFTDILARKYAERPELLHAGRLERQTAEASAFYESEN